MNSTTRFGLFAVAATLVTAAACGKSAAAADESLTRDLAAATGTGGDIELAPRAARNQTVVSAIEGGPTAAPKKASVAPSKTPAPVRRQPQPQPQPKMTTAAIEEAAVEPTPAPAPRSAEPAPAPARAVEPPPLPPATK